ncbi:calcium-binding protein [Streptomyces sp. AC536]|uniref:calcium-binding protein n=1 Tax=Streptomyces buecherae TaxID=2763006 RepID=UPI00164E9D20|nr:calcium-binding protein [Streptomyces buecherae]MBC3982163.1 calcium-binding protein [Streptomyces buecherae]QNJ41845.1 calcium-binding protein [Streptomyces buecherae]
MRKSASLAVLAVTSATVLSGLTATAAHADGYGDTKITKVVVNGGKNVVVGTSGAKTFTVAVTAQDNSGIQGAKVDILGPSSGFFQPTKAVTCVAATNKKVSTCTATFKIDPRVDLYTNALAGTWYVDAWVDAKDDDFFTSDKAGSFRLQREGKLTVNASPEPVKKGKTLTVTGKLTRAHWDVFGDNKWVNHGNQSAKLEFRKKGAKTFSTVKTVKGNKNGDYKTTVKASVDGDWRWNFAGYSTHAAVASGVDFVDVK